jgi:hypothetical protein
MGLNKKEKREVERAHKLAESDPEGALAILERYSVRVPDVTVRFAGALDIDEILELSKTRVGLYERCGRPKDAAAEQAGATRFLESQLDFLDRKLETDESHWPLLQKATVLARLGRRTEADRYQLRAADIWLANIEAKDTGSGRAGAFRLGMKMSEERSARNLRDNLLFAGRAIGFAQCERCGGVVRANYVKRRCVAGHKVDQVRVVVKEDAPPSLQRTEKPGEEPPEAR